jgi:hypothetical protein
MLMMPDQATAYRNLVNVKAAGTTPAGSPAGYVACGTKGETRVIPNNSAMSLLYTKVNGTQDCGLAMPRGKPLLSTSDIAMFKSWIDQGAQNN